MNDFSNSTFSIATDFYLLVAQNWKKLQSMAF